MSCALLSTNPSLGGRFGYFLFFSLREGEGGVRGAGEGGGGDGVFIENPRGGGGLQDGKGRGRRVISK